MGKADGGEWRKEAKWSGMEMMERVCLLHCTVVVLFKAHL